MTDFSSLSKDQLVQLADDLVSFIRNAHWKEGEKNNLAGPTLHMNQAIGAYERYIADPCPTCGHSRRIF